MNKLEKFRIADTSEAEEQSALEQKVETTLEQINRVQDVLEQQKATLTKDRGMFGKAMRFFQEKVLRTDTAEKALDQKIAALEKCKYALTQDADQLDSVQQYLQQEHAGEALATSDDTDKRLSVFINAIQDTGFKSGKFVDDEDATQRAKTLLTEEDQLMANFFAEGDAMNKTAELEQAAQEQNTTAYKEKLAEAQSSIEVKIATLQELASAERSKNNGLAIEKKALNDKPSVNPAIADWFNQGSALILQSEVAKAESPVTKLYQEQLKKGSQSTRAQMRAFEGLLSGRFSVPKFSSIIEKIRKELGGGLVIDKGIRDGAGAELATGRIKDHLQQLPKFEDLKTLPSGRVEMYDLNEGDKKLAVVIKSEKRVITLTQTELAQAGIQTSEVERLLPSSLEQINAYVEEHWADEKVQEEALRREIGELAA